MGVPVVTTRDLRHPRDDRRRRARPAGRAARPGWRWPRRCGRVLDRPALHARAGAAGARAHLRALRFAPHHARAARPVRRAAAARPSARRRRCAPSRGPVAPGEREQRARPVARAAAAAAGGSLFLAPWRALDDAALLAHFRASAACASSPWSTPKSARRERIAALMQGRFEFNGETHHAARPDRLARQPERRRRVAHPAAQVLLRAGPGQAWQRSGDARYVQRWAGLVDGWMRGVPPGFIAADVTGRRVQNWIYSLHGFVLRRPAPQPRRVDAAFWRRLLRSLHEQVEFLCANLTPKRNHRTLELLAIFLAGVVFPEFERAAHWREFALDETLVNLQADLLPDGVHCELSTDYHHLALRNWLQVRRSLRENGVRRAGGMDRALRARARVQPARAPAARQVPSLSDGDARGFLAAAAQGASCSAARTCASSPRGARRAAAGAAQRISPPAATTCCAAAGTPRFDRAAPGVRLRPAGRGQPRPLRRAVLRAGGPRPSARRRPGPLHLQRGRARPTGACTSAARRRTTRCASTAVPDALRAQGRSRKPRATRPARCATRSPARRRIAR
jgi:hypothetical protein